MLAMIEKWVFNNQSKPKLTMEIADPKLKKKLSQRITKLYENSGISIEYHNNVSQTLVKKGINFSTFYNLKNRGWENDGS